MLKTISLFVSLIAVSLFSTGCAGPESKLGRGLNNMTEFFRGGEIQRSVEQTAIFDNPDTGYTTGFFHGVDRSIARTAAGMYEVLTFPVPNHGSGDYGPIYHPANTVYPDVYKPNWMADTIFSPDAALEFSGGDIAPFIPGSRFRIFDN